MNTEISFNRNLAPVLLAANLEMDSLFESAASQAADLHQVLAMSVGTLVFQATRNLGLCSGAGRILASMIGLGVEAGSFGSVNRLFKDQEDNSGNFLESWRRDFVQFGMMKTIGQALATSNIVLRHGISSLGMMWASDATASLGWTPREEGSFSERMVHGMAMSAAMDLASPISQFLSGGKLHFLQTGLQARNENHISASAAVRPINNMRSLDARNDILILGHRGVRWENIKGQGAHTLTSAAPENTMQAFELAMKHGADGIEFDVMLTADGHAVVTHGEIDHFTGSTLKRPVSSHPLAELRSADIAASYRGPGKSNPHQIPLLSEVLDRFSREDFSHAFLNIEIKSEGVIGQGVATVEKVVQALRVSTLISRVIVSSFDPLVLVRLKELAPEIRRGILLDSYPSPGFPSPQEMLEKHLPHIEPYSIHAENVLVNRQMMDGAQTHGFKVFIWFVNGPDGHELIRLQNLKVNGLIVDDPAQTRALFATRSRPTQAKAYAVLQAHSPLSPFTLERRAPEPRDVVLDIHFCGVCHTDIHQTRNEWGGAHFPLVPGHEITGVVRDVGSEVIKFKIGESVAVGCMVSSCRRCDPCLRGLEQYCGKVVTTYNSLLGGGNSHTQGGYSDHIVVHEDFVLRVPPKLPLDAGAPLLCAGATVYSPLKHWKVGPGQRVAILGLGGLGHMGVKLASALGAEVSVLSHSPGKKADALRLGAHHFYADSGDFFHLTDHFDLILNTSSAALDWNQYLRMLKLDGSMVVVGLPERPVSISPFSLIGGRRKLAGSYIASLQETQEMLDFCAERGIVSDIERISIQQVNQAYERLMQGEVRYRFVIDMGTIR